MSSFDKFAETRKTKSKKNHIGLVMCVKILSELQKQNKYYEKQRDYLQKQHYRLKNVILQDPNLKKHKIW